MRLTCWRLLFGFLAKYLLHGRRGLSLVTFAPFAALISSAGICDACAQYSVAALLRNVATEWAAKDRGITFPIVLWSPLKNQHFHFETNEKC